MSKLAEQRLVRQPGIISSIVSASDVSSCSDFPCKV